MSRGKSAAKKNSSRVKGLSQTSADKLTRIVMKHGKATIAEEIVREAMKEATAKLPKSVELPEHNDVREKETLMLEKVIEIVTPRVEVKSRRVGGANYQVPMMVNRERGRTLALRWLVDAARDRKEGKPMSVKLAREFLDVLEGKGGAVNRKETQDKMASANRANANLVRRDQPQKDKSE